MELLIGKIVASNFREIASGLYMVSGYPALDTSYAIG